MESHYHPQSAISANEQTQKPNQIINYHMFSDLNRVSGNYGMIIKYKSSTKSKLINLLNLISRHGEVVAGYYEDRNDQLIGLKTLLSDIVRTPILELLPLDRMPKNDQNYYERWSAVVNTRSQPDTNRKKVEIIKGNKEEPRGTRRGNVSSRLKRKMEPQDNLSAGLVRTFR
eukprot:NODE_660_length_4952_cov_0.391304.p4 type:complete len:172 gc:universal NODE_660_length_4952_cov_0.391304:3943-3428(-)